MSHERPLGIVILVILQVIGGIFWLGASASAFMGAGVAAMVPVFGWLAGGILILLGLIALFLGLLSFFVAYGLWGGRPWAWTLAILFAILGVIMGILSLPGGILNILIGIVIIYYLTRPHVKTFFGKL